MVDRVAPGELWLSLRKGTTMLHAEWGPASGTLFASPARMRKGPPVTIALDLDKNFRTRHTGVGTYVDAQALADGGIAELRLVQTSEDQVVSGLRLHLQHTEDRSTPWRLLLTLRGREHGFNVEPEFRPLGDRHTLILHVVEGRHVMKEYLGFKYQISVRSDGRYLFVVWSLARCHLALMS